jgi:hypothetical protein
MCICMCVCAFTCACDGSYSFACAHVHADANVLAAYRAHAPGRLGEPDAAGGGEYTACIALAPALTSKHTPKDAYEYAHAHAHTQPCLSVHAYKYADVNLRTLRNVHIPAREHAYLGMLVCTNMQRRTQMRTHMHMRNPISLHMRKHICMHLRMHRHTCAC